MQSLLAAAGKAFLKAFAACLVVLAPGIWKAPDLAGAELVAVSALLASVAAGIAALQVYVPLLTVAAYVKPPWGPWIDSFLRTFTSGLIALLPGALLAPDLRTVPGLVAAAVLGAFTLAFHVLQGLLTPGQVPAPAVGLPPNGPASLSRPPRQ